MLLLIPQQKTRWIWLIRSRKHSWGKVKNCSMEGCGHWRQNNWWTSTTDEYALDAGFINIPLDSLHVSMNCRKINPIIVNCKAVGLRDTLLTGYWYSTDSPMYAIWSGGSRHGIAATDWKSYSSAEIYYWYPYRNSASDAEVKADAIRDRRMGPMRPGPVMKLKRVMGRSIPGNRLVISYRSRFANRWHGVISPSKLYME